MLMIIGADLPAPSANPQESKRPVVAYFGTYSVDETAKTITSPPSELPLQVLTGSLARHP
jgi:hypothetical protein